jgi:hypothetical protein
LIQIDQEKAPSRAAEEPEQLTENKKVDGRCDVLEFEDKIRGFTAKRLGQMLIDYSIENAVFDKVIGAFKVKGKHIELDRTTHDKTVDDLTRCAKIHKTTNICFLDDQYHPKMKNDNVYYINVKPYIYNLKYDEMAERYYNAFSNTFLDDVVDKNDFINEITSFMNEFRYTITDKTSKEFGVDKFISQRMMYHLKCFFNEPKRNKTIKKAKRKRNNGTKKH